MLADTHICFRPVYIRMCLFVYICVYVCVCVCMCVCIRIICVCSIRMHSFMRSSVYILQCLMIPRTALKLMYFRMEQRSTLCDVGIRIWLASLLISALLYVLDSCWGCCCLSSLRIWTLKWVIYVQSCAWVLTLHIRIIQNNSQKAFGVKMLSYFDQSDGFHLKWRKNHHHSNS